MKLTRHEDDNDRVTVSLVASFKNGWFSVSAVTMGQGLKASALKKTLGNEDTCAIECRRLNYFAWTSRFNGDSGYNSFSGAGQVGVYLSLEVALSGGLH